MTATNPPPRPPRAPVRLSAELEVDGRKLAGVTRNLSAGGVCVEIDRPVAEGRELSITLFVVEDDVEAEGSNGLEVRGSVQWTAEADRGYAIGIKFAGLSDLQSKQLNHALRALGIS